MTHLENQAMVSQHMNKLLSSNPSKLFFAVAALCIGAVPLAELYHDWVNLEGGLFDELFHFLWGNLGILNLVYLISILGLLGHLSRSIGRDRKRAFVAMIVWSVIGIIAVGLAAIGSDFLQSEYNTDAYKRVTPDDYLTWIVIPGLEPGDPQSVLVLNRPNAFSTYSWTRMTIVEVAYMIIMASAAAWSVLFVNRRNPKLGVAAIPISLIAALITYVWIAAPWAFQPDYDIFIGDRILGTMAFNAFVFFDSDPTAGLTMFAYVLSIICMVFIWKPLTADSRSSDNQQMN
ncbi:MAG: hypothetical protein WBB85_01530 [Albidovulum sp.]|uniref:hypothetical protein n=1 Tax=Albidovulum sp. TaxID=1872424 RepID=UPI003CA93F76